MEGRKEKVQTTDPWWVVSQFKEAGSDGGGREVCCASCKLLASEGVVSEAFELWNKDPIVMPLTLGLGGCVEAFPLELLGSTSPTPQGLALPTGARILPVPLLTGLEVPQVECP